MQITIRLILLLILFSQILACGSKAKDGKVLVAFVDAFEDATLAQARKGFFKALRDSGFVNDSNLTVMYRNAQGDMATLVQSIDQCIYAEPALIASSSTSSTLACLQRTRSIPVCMMVAPDPKLMNIVNEKGKAPANLFGVYENLNYIDTAIQLIPTLFPEAKKIGALVNQSEVQSVDALERLKQGCAQWGIELIWQAANNSAETQAITESLIGKGIDAFFALPDNTVFASFETIAKSCDRKGIPIITSESGLVARGATLAFGADLFSWGYEAGAMAAQFLHSGVLPAPVLLSKRMLAGNRQKVGDRPWKNREDIHWVH